LKTRTKYEAGDTVTIVHKTLGTQTATIVAALPGGLYLVSWEGKTATIHERYIS
jgi:hypothetical protein